MNRFLCLLFLAVVTIHGSSALAQAADFYPPDSRPMSLREPETTNKTTLKKVSSITRHTKKKHKAIGKIVNKQHNRKSYSIHKHYSRTEVGDFERPGTVRTAP